MQCMARLIVSRLLVKDRNIVVPQLVQLKHRFQPTMDIHLTARHLGQTKRSLQLPKDSLSAPPPSRTKHRSLADKLSLTNSPSIPPAAPKEKVKRSIYVPTEEHKATRRANKIHVYLKDQTIQRQPDHNFQIVTTSALYAIDQVPLVLACLDKWMFRPGDLWINKHLENLAKTKVWFLNTQNQWVEVTKSYFEDNAATYHPVLEHTHVLTHTKNRREEPAWLTKKQFFKRRDQEMYVNPPWPPIPGSSSEIRAKSPAPN
ncbi:uncharacterized protein LACBIDRAFT_304823 [Laccaria bicolor S238N-H82]|uniref:Predicted protein n=1 Tax=Laccaria bicolor (strain S238N-H82 / ATCC MYA-4686) TaxID=486041 RepID=B0DMF3_LACBS|nr:uncharacterized protein LACBIDRAFT_304823 [Laccaria bicolor S238N-H82]EDR04276.1 predicted protein [Laccaria bicolor S238N-H82]|eukprot:XP_001885167.1 predicted protein [Laccaria bicolor S238N-H82]